MFHILKCGFELLSLDPRGPCRSNNLGQRAFSEVLNSGFYFLCNLACNHFELRVCSAMEIKIKIIMSLTLFFSASLKLTL